MTIRESSGALLAAEIQTTAIDSIFFTRDCNQRIMNIFRKIAETEDWATPLHPFHRSTLIPNHTYRRRHSLDNYILPASHFCCFFLLHRKAIHQTLDSLDNHHRTSCRLFRFPYCLRHSSFSPMPKRLEKDTLMYSQKNFAVSAHSLRLVARVCRCEVLGQSARSISKRRSVDDQFLIQIGGRRKYVGKGE